MAQDDEKLEKLGELILYIAKRLANDRRGGATKITAIEEPQDYWSLIEHDHRH